jgi:hypothetical protein
MTPTASDATDQTKLAIENAVTWYLHEKLGGAGVSIATQKYLTNDNRLIYLTKCTVVEPAVPTIKIQVLERVDGGVHETGYQIYEDLRFEKYQTAMIFGTASGTADTSGQPVSETEAQELIALLAALPNNARALL